MEWFVNAQEIPREQETECESVPEWRPQEPSGKSHDQPRRVAPLVPCFEPQAVAQTAEGEPIAFGKPMAWGLNNLTIPCGKCIGCRTARAATWAVRCMHEAKGWRYNSFITLTYDDEHLPPRGWLEPRELQLFFKRLRKAYAGRVRLFASGEYGSTTNRPHYHALLFNVRFDDQRQVGKDLYESEQLRELWPKGGHRIGAVTAKSACYIAKYSLKQTPKEQREYVVDDDGVITYRPEPFVRMSLRPGLGALWLEKYGGDLREGFLVVDGEKLPVPRAYLERLDRSDDPTLHSLAEEIRSNREINHTPSNKNHMDRLRAAEVIAAKRLQQKEARMSL